MHHLKQDLLERARIAQRRIVFPEGDDIRVVEAAYQMATAGIAQPVLIAEPAAFEAARKDRGLGEPTFEVVDPTVNTDPYAAIFLEKRRSRGKAISEEEAEAIARDPLFRAALMVTQAEAAAAVGGAVRTTSDTVRAAIQCIGPKGKTVSSFFLMILPENRGTLLYADCGVIPQPSASQLADIAIASGMSWQRLTGSAPRIAFLSFSTKGSARDESIAPVLTGLAMAQDLAPDWVIEGELQADAALVPEVAAKKAPDSALQGDANVLVFPNLHAGNIAYKLTERLAGATALGPVLQGLNQPMNDLSRGCSVEDIVLVSAISAIQAG